MNNEQTGRSQRSARRITIVGRDNGYQQERSSMVHGWFQGRGKSLTSF